MGVKHGLLIIRFIIPVVFNNFSSLLQLTLYSDLQDEHKVFPWLQTFITTELRGKQAYFSPLFKLVSKILSRVYCNIWFLDVTFPNRWTGRDGPTPWPPRSPDITPLQFLLWRYVKDKVFSTPVPDITILKGKNNRHFVYNNWRHVGEHVERNWLSIRRSSCNKRSTCWSVLMCYKKTYWVTF